MQITDNVSNYPKPIRRNSISGLATVISVPASQGSFDAPAAGIVGIQCPKIPPSAIHWWH